MEKNKNIIIIILLIFAILLGLSTFYYLNLCKNLNKENSELKIKISNTDNQTENTEQKNETKSESSITEEQAKEIMEDYRKNVVLDNIDMYKFVEVIKEKVKFEHHFIISNNKYEKEKQDGELLLNGKDEEKEVYAIYYISDDNLEKMTGYVDIDSGEILGVYRSGI